MTNNKSTEFVNCVCLLNANNNTLVKTELTDNKGKVLLNNIAGEAIALQY